MTKRRTDNTMTKRRTDNTMTKRRTDNTMTKRKKTLQRLCFNCHLEDQEMVDF
jgi:hypothetical protein